MTCGVRGVACYQANGEVVRLPAFATSSIDRIGAGDSYLALSALSMAKGMAPIVGSFLGSIAAAMSVQMIGNQEAIKKSQLCKYLIRLMK